jgi:hypothetical protein
MPGFYLPEVRGKKFSPLIYTKRREEKEEKKEKKR